MCCFSFFVSVSVYLILGSLYNAFGPPKKSGVEIIPNHEFWHDLPSLVRDGALFMCRPCGVRPAGSYEMLPA